MPLVLSRVCKEDFDELLEVQFRAFDHLQIHTALLGPNTKTNRDRCKAQFIADMAEDPSDYWMKAVDLETGRLVSAAQWKVHPSWAPIFEDDVSADFHEGEAKADAEDVMRDFFTRRKRHMYGRPHILLYILFTDPAYQRQGAGSALVKWGCNLADLLMVPAWLEGTAEGHHLYEQNGFTDVEVVHYQTRTWLSEYTIMKREPRQQRIEAGKIAAAWYTNRTLKGMVYLLSLIRASGKPTALLRMGAVGFVALLGFLYNMSMRPN